MRNRVTLRALIEEQLCRRPAHEWLEQINAAGIPATLIYSIDRALDNEIVRSLQVVAEVGHSTLGQLKLVGRPFTVGTHRQGWLRRPPPLLGEHSIEIGLELGHRTSEIEGWLASGVLKDARVARRAT